jgi:hypothetical protein
MNFYYRSLPDGRREVVCTRCFLTLGAARDMEDVRRIEGSHQCAATRMPALRPVSPGALRSHSGRRFAATLETVERVAHGYSGPQMLRNIVLLMAASLVLYVLPKVLELTAMRHWNPLLSMILPGDLAGCAFLVVVFGKVKEGISLYCLLTVMEAWVYWAQISPLNVLSWIIDLVPTLVVLVIVMRSARQTARVVTIR